MIVVNVNMMMCLRSYMRRKVGEHFVHPQLHLPFSWLYYLLFWRLIFGLEARPSALEPRIVLYFWKALLLTARL